MNSSTLTKGSHQSPNFDTCKCSGENLPNFSCHFPNHKTVFLQILHDFSVSWMITALYFFRSKVIYFPQKRPIKVKIFETFECSDQNSPNSCHFWNNIFFFKFCIHSSVSWDINPLYFFNWNFICFRQKKPIKVQIWWNFTWTVESLKFCTLMGSFLFKSYKVSAKKYRRVISHDTEEWCKYREKLTCGFKYELGYLLNFHPTTQKFENFTSFDYFCRRYIRFDLTKYMGVIFHHTVKDNPKFE